MVLIVADISDAGLALLGDNISAVSLEDIGLALPDSFDRSGLKTAPRGRKQTFSQVDPLPQMFSDDSTNDDSCGLGFDYSTNDSFSCGLDLEMSRDYLSDDEGVSFSGFG